MTTSPPSTTALVLANLGTPEAPTPAAVRAYLSEFLMDRRVVHIPRIVWWPLLHGVILPRRSAPVARKYASIWMLEGSPLAVLTARLARAVQAQLPQVRVMHAMRYGTPALREVLARLVDGGIAHIAVLPLYPQYSTTTTASIEDIVQVARTSHPRTRIDMLQDYHIDARWVEAVADGIRRHWQAHGRGERLLLSFHGIPRALVDAGDPYAVQCEASTQAIARALGIPRDEIMLTYQSRFGRAEWLQPYTLGTLQALAAQGVRTVDVACPGFAVDCLETLEEIQVENAHAFRKAGGEALRYIPCANDSDAHARAIAALGETLLTRTATA